MIIKITLGVFAALGLLLVLRMVSLGLSPKSPPALGITDGHLTPCPRKRNCVSSQAKGRAHGIAPIAASGTLEHVMARAHDAISSMSRARITEIEGGYLRAEFQSRLFRFVDDLELLWRPDDEHFDVRSASRVGNSDLGANRRRVEALRRRLEGPTSKPTDQRVE
jgi:uncharacterized protein (DUF1499 family)